jgi:hypothetical protein
MVTCSTCGAKIVWVETERGKSMPLDVGKVLGGNVEVDGGLVGGIARVVKPEPDVLRYVSHFVTCPQAAKHRKGGKHGN